MRVTVDAEICNFVSFTERFEIIGFIKILGTYKKFGNIMNIVFLGRFSMIEDIK